MKLHCGIALLSLGLQLLGAEALISPPRATKGLHFSRVDLPEGPWSVSVVKVDRAKSPCTWQTVLGNGDRFGLSTLSEQVRHLPAGLGRPMAAINGDYYRSREPYAGDPKGLQIMQGALVSGPCEWACFWIDPNGQPQMGIVAAQFSVGWPDGTKTAFGLNEERERDMAVLFTSAVGSSTRTSDGRELILERNGADPWLPLRPGEVYRARVREVREVGDTSIRPDTAVLSLGPALVARLPQISAGAVVSLSTAMTPDLRAVTTAIGGGPILVREGKALPRHEVTVRHPRSAIGWNAEFLYLVEVDGRQPLLSVGMTYPELSEFLVKLGCQSAIGLDGGGSATCWVYGQVMNSPAEGQERPMANSLVLVQPETK